MRRDCVHAMLPAIEQREGVPVARCATCGMAFLAIRGERINYVDVDVLFSSCHGPNSLQLDRQER